MYYAIQPENQTNVLGQAPLDWLALRSVLSAPTEWSGRNVS